MKNIFLFFLAVFLWNNVLKYNVVRAQTSNLLFPLNVSPLLSGNFGELRETHFHSGIDIKTGGREGLPVRCVNDGRIARIKVSATGYGNALYVEHPDGKTSVYAHLQRYNRQIAAVVRDFQYRYESFEIDEDVREMLLWVHKGDTLAYSGNTGSSGGPHLHFEVRDTRTEAALNPLLFLGIKDKIAPKIRGLYFYRISDQGEVSREKRLVPKADEQGGYLPLTVTLPAGKVGIGVFVSDVMNDSWNKLGVYRINAVADGKTFFHMTVDTCLFDRNVCVNVLKDFHLYRRNRETVYRTFGEELQQLPGVQVKGNGCLSLEEGQCMPVEIEFADINGNCSRVKLKLVGGKRKIFSRQQMLLKGIPHTLRAGKYQLDLDSSALFHSVAVKVNVDTLILPIYGKSEIFQVTSEEYPLLSNALLSVSLDSMEQYVACRLSEKNHVEVLPVHYTSEGIYTQVKCLGRYTVLKDRIAPEIKYAGIIGRRLQFTIKDNLSGIAFYRGEINGRWGLFEYDAKTGSLICSLQEPFFVKGKNEVVLTVRDRVGNVSKKTVTIVK